MRASAKSASQSALDRVSASAHQMVDGVSGAAAPAANWIGGHVDDMVDSKKKLMVDSSRYIAKNPLTAVAVAAAAGYLVSQIFRSTRR